MGKIRNSLAGLLITGLVAGSANAGPYGPENGYLSPTQQNSISAGNALDNSKLEKQLKEQREEMERLQRQIERQRATLREMKKMQNEYKQEMQNYQEPQRGSEEKGEVEFFAFTREGWVDKNGNGLPTKDEVSNAYKKYFETKDEILFNVNFGCARNAASGSFTIIDTDKRQIMHEENFEYSDILFQGIHFNDFTNFSEGNYKAIFYDNSLKKSLEYEFAVLRDKKL